MSITLSQKRSLLDQLNGFLTGNENVKRVMNSPTLDHNGKMLSYDGQKVFTAGSRGRGGRGRGNNNNRNDRNGDRKRKNDNEQGSSNGGRGGKAKKQVIYTKTTFFLFSKLTLE